MAYADSIRTTDYTREELATLIDGNRFVGEAVTTAGTVPNYTVTLTPAPASYYDGMSFPIEIHSTLNVSGATLNVNGLGAKNLKITRVGTTVRDPIDGELSSRCVYFVTYESSNDMFVIANPTFGASAVDYTPTLSVPSGTIDWYLSNPATYNFSTYQYLTGNTVKVYISGRFALSGSAAGYIDMSLPVPYHSSELNASGDSQIVSLSTYQTFDIATGGMFIADNYRFYTSNNVSFPIDNSFYVRARVIYQVG